MSKQTLTLIIVLGLITAALLYGATQPTNKPSNNQIATPTQVQTAQSTLALTPSSLILSSPSGSLDVVLDTYTNNVTAVQIELLYDPKSLSNVDIEVGPFLTNGITLLKNIDEANGRVSFALGITPTASAVKGKGIVATITFQSLLLPNAKTEIMFLPKTLVTAEGVTTSVLKSSSGATIMMTTTTSTSPSPAQSVSPQPTQ